MRKYIPVHLMFIMPLLITTLVVGSGLILMYNLPRVVDTPQTIASLKSYLIWSTILSFLVGLALAYAILVPLKKLTAVSRSLSTVDIETKKLPLHFEKEIEDLFSTLDNTKVSLLAQRKKELLQRLTSLGLMAAGVAHELRNPLGAIKGLISLIDEDLSPTDRKKEYTNLTLSEINRLEETISKFLNLCSGTAKELKPQEINIDSLLDEILSLVKFQPRPAKIEILRDRALMPLIFKGYRDQLKQAFLNIVMNACEAMPDGGTLRISTRRIGDNLRVVFSDTGRGIDENDMDKIFDPFYTTKDTNAGLGLTVAQQIVLSHQGVIEVKSAPQRGADVFVTFPQNAL